LNKAAYTIKENSWIAKLAAKKLQTDAVAIVIGSVIHLHNTTSQAFLQNKKWVKHELCHIEQFKQHGFFTFILKYIWQSILHGYYNNKYEVEARLAEEQ
jgi:hypothetical protein